MADDGAMRRSLLAIALAAGPWTAASAEPPRHPYLGAAGIGAAMSPAPIGPSTRFGDLSRRAVGRATIRTVRPKVVPPKTNP